MIIENDEQVSGDSPLSDRTDPGRNRSAAEAAERLETAITAAGGPSAVSRRAGIPLASLNRVRGGQDMKVSVLTALARATGVRLEWLATGAGPMRQPAQESIPSPPATAPEPRSFTPPNVEHLAEAIRRAGRLYEEKNRTPSPRIYAQILLLLCDEIAAAEKHVDISQPD